MFISDEGIYNTININTSKSFIHLTKLVTLKHEGSLKTYVYSYTDVLHKLQKDFPGTKIAQCIDKNGFNILHIVVKEGRIELLDAIHIHGCYIKLLNQKVPDEMSEYVNMTPLGIATKMATKDGRAVMVENMVELRTKDQSMNALHKASMMGNLKKVKRSLSKHPEMLHEKASDGTTAAYWGVSSRNLEVVRVLHNSEADMSCTSAKGDTLLTRALHVQCRRIIDYLLTNVKLDPNKAGADGKIPIKMAIEQCDIKSVDIMIRCGAHLPESCIIEIVKSGNIRILTSLMSKFALNLQYTDVNGKTAIMLAANKGMLDIAKELIKHGADIRVNDKHGHNVLHAAVEGGNPKVLKLLLEHVAKEGILDELLNAQNRYLGGERCFLVRGRDKGQIAFHYVEVNRSIIHIFRKITKSGGSLDVAQYGRVIKSGWGAYPSPDILKMIDAQYSVSRITSDSPPDFTPLSLAIFKENNDCTIMLLNHPKIKIEICDSFGMTPLHFACLRGNLAVVKILKEMRARIDVQDNDLKRPVDIAEINKHFDVVNYLNSTQFVTSELESLAVSI